jgi:hypothetical protein
MPLNAPISPPNMIALPYLDISILALQEINPYPHFLKIGYFRKHRVLILRLFAIVIKPEMLVDPSPDLIHYNPCCFFIPL